MKKTIAIVAAVAVVAAGGAYYVVRQRATTQMEEAIAAFRASLPPGSNFGYASAAPALFSRSGQFTDVTLTTAGRTITAATLDVAPGEGRSLRHLTATKVTTKAPSAQISMERVAVDALALPVPVANLADIDPAAVSFDHAAVQGFRSIPDAASPNAGASNAGASVDLAGITVDGYGTGKPTAVALDGIVAKRTGSPVDSVSLDRLRLRGVLLADVIAHARSGPGTGTGAWPHGDSYGLELGKLSVTAAGKPFVSFAALTTGSDMKATNQLEARLDLQDLVVVATPDLTPGLRDLGYEQVQGGVQMHATVDRAAQQLRMDKLDIDAPAMGRLHLALGLDNVPFQAIAPTSGQVNPMAFLAMAQAQLQSAELTYEDRSLVGKALAMAAAEQKTTPAALTQGITEQVKAIGAQLHLGPAVLDPVLAFINDPRRLTVTVRPPQPIALLGLSRAAADPERTLGLTVTR